MFFDETPPEVSKPTGASHVDSTTPLTLGSTAVGSEGTPASSEPIESMKRRIRHLEEQLYKASSGSAQTPGATPGSVIETTTTQMTATFHVHHGDNRLFGRASTFFGQDALISRSISHKTRLFGQSHWVNGILPLVSCSQTYVTASQGLHRSLTTSRFEIWWS